jgi:hypothetical protein
MKRTIFDCKYSILINQHTCMFMLGFLTRVGALNLWGWQQQHVHATFGLGCRFLKILSFVSYERGSAVHLSCFRVTTRSIYPLYESLVKTRTQVMTYSV